MMPFDPIDFAINRHTIVDLESERIRAEWEWEHTPWWKKVLIKVSSFVDMTVFRIKEKIRPQGPPLF